MVYYGKKVKWYGKVGRYKTWNGMERNGTRSDLTLINIAKLKSDSETKTTLLPPWTTREVIN